MTQLFWFALGLIVGWNFLAQPAIVKEWVDKAKEFVFGK